jgi:hypothetical protein
MPALCYVQPVCIDLREENRPFKLPHQGFPNESLLMCRQLPKQSRTFLDITLQIWSYWLGCSVVLVIFGLQVLCDLWLCVVDKENSRTAALHVPSGYISWVFYDALSYGHYAEILGKTSRNAKAVRTLQSWIVFRRFQAEIKILHSFTQHYGANYRGKTSKLHHERNFPKPFQYIIL